MKEIFFWASIIAYILYVIVEEDITDKLGFLSIMSFLFYIDNKIDKTMNELKFNSQICTTKEQSQRLLDLGLKPETADMCWLNDMQKPFCAPYKCLVDRAQDMKWVIYPAWSLHRLIELYSDVEDTSSLCIKDVSYKLLIFCIEKAIHCGFFNKKYLKL